MSSGTLAGSTTTTTSPTAIPTTKDRALASCDSCSRRKKKCVKDGNKPCSDCARLGVPYTFDRPKNDRKSGFSRKKPDLNEEWREIELDSRKFRVSSLGRTQLADGVITQEEGKKYVNHIDGNTINNKSSNLEWCTPKENAQYTVRLGLGYQRAIKQILDNSSFQEFPSLAEA
ncbi:hypothetical protein C2G38_2166905 [Gigaspora rosea]|uniref:Zn(2)-C6 fungal-type domain-containing protein n=1 Tax=Gigaspora rosea TaxID=44941 RepID=A0A397VUM4_9GLOM|nr:hypothetical protein C2G38_2166905 [Gigaspora rosea]